MNQHSFSTLPSCLGQVCVLDLAAAVHRSAAGYTAPRRSATASPGRLKSGASIVPLRFVLRQAPGSTSYLHLALFCHGRQLAHWVLPSSSRQEVILLPSAYMVEATALALPDRVVDEGDCVLYNHSADPTTALVHDLRAGSLQVQLQGSTLRGHFFLERLHFHSQTWELGRLRPQLPPHHSQAMA